MNKYSNGKSFHAFWPTLIYLLGLFVVLVGVTIPALAVTPDSQAKQKDIFDLFRYIA